MAKDETRQLPPSVLTEDREIYAALKEIKNYAPANQAFAQSAIDTSLSNMVTAQEAEAQAAAAWAAARDDKVAAEWGFHNMILGGKDQVKAQFGPNSNEVQAVKLKKKTEYKSPRRKAKSGNGSNQ
jgi:hypothetical protein